MHVEASITEPVPVFSTTGKTPDAMTALTCSSRLTEGFVDMKNDFQEGEVPKAIYGEKVLLTLKQLMQYKDKLPDEWWTCVEKVQYNKTKNVTDEELNRIVSQYLNGSKISEYPESSHSSDLIDQNESCKRQHTEYSIV